MRVPTKNYFWPSFKNIFDDVFIQRMTKPLLLLCVFKWVSVHFVGQIIVVLLFSIIEVSKI